MIKSFSESVLSCLRSALSLLLSQIRRILFLFAHRARVVCSGRVLVTRDQLLNLFQEWEQADFYVWPNIPASRIQFAQQRCEIVPDEEILALLDANAQGQGRSLLVFGTRHIYCHNDWRCRCPGKGCIEYSELRSQAIQRQSWAELTIHDSIRFDRSGSQWSSQQVVELLRAITPLMVSAVSQNCLESSISQQKS